MSEGKHRTGISTEALLCGFVGASIPLSPNFISLASLTPPGVSVIARPATIADLLLCIGAAVVASFLLVRERSAPQPLAAWMTAYICSWALASLLGFDPESGLLAVLALVTAAVFHAGILAWKDRPYVIRALYGTFFLTGTAVSLLGIGMVVLRRPALLYAMVHGRATSTFIVPGEFAGYLLLLTWTALGVVLTVRSTFWRALSGGALLTGIIALGMTYSRAGWLGAVAGAAFFLYAHCRQSGKSRLRAACAGFAPVLVSLVIAGPLFHRHHNPSEDFVRLPIWQAGLRAIELFPLTGTGPDSFRHVYPLLRPVAGEPNAFHVHSVLLTAFAETGLAGLATLCAFWLRFIKLFRERLRETQPARRTFALAIAAGLVATWAQGALDYVQVIVLGCWLPFTALALAAAEQGFPDI